VSRNSDFAIGRPYPCFIYNENLCGMSGKTLYLSIISKFFGAAFNLLTESLKVGTLFTAFKPELFTNQ
jgi:hypothetical protein